MALVGEQLGFRVRLLSTIKSNSCTQDPLSQTTAMRRNTVIPVRLNPSWFILRVISPLSSPVRHLKPMQVLWVEHPQPSPVCVGPKVSPGGVQGPQGCV